MMKTDLQIQKDVIAELSCDTSFDASQVGAMVKDGIVTLIGSVNQYTEKWAIESALKKIDGVVALVIEIEVNLMGENCRSDEDIARSVKNILQWTANLPSEKIRILVENGWITLSGDLEFAHQKLLVTESLRNLMDVKGVINHINIMSSSLSSNVKADIQEALKRCALLNAKEIMVSNVAGTVMLTGTVHSYFERDIINEAALKTLGVIDVVNNIRVIQ